MWMGNNSAESEGNLQKARQEREKKKIKTTQNIDKTENRRKAPFSHLKASNLQKAEETYCMCESGTRWHEKNS